jgi:hypothetical protein
MEASALMRDGEQNDEFGERALKGGRFVRLEQSSRASDDIDVVSSPPSVPGYATWMKVGWTRENE